MTRENTVNVPREPTREMIEAAIQAASFYVGTFEEGQTPVEPVSVIVYRAMLSAAPLHEGEGEDWSELERLAKDATPGPWGVHEQRPSPSASVSGTFVHAGPDEADDTGFSLVARTYTRDGLEERQHNAAFIAAANPATILKLIASARSAPPPSVEVERLREALKPFAEAAAARDDKGDWEMTTTVVKYLRDARAALSRKEQEPGQ